jgi:hypothetical protein
VVGWAAARRFMRNAPAAAGIDKAAEDFEGELTRLHRHWVLGSTANPASAGGSSPRKGRSKSR